MKLTIVMLYAVALAICATVQTGVSAMAVQQSVIIKLDTQGGRGVVYFDHRKHEALINPDANFVYKNKAKKNAACAGCHHTESRRGIVQLWKCVSCHKGEGNDKNPKNVDSDEVYAERAFHDMCIGCHKANIEAGISIKGRTTCGGCHKAE
ncbi:MAG: cytochrome c3 family protein [Acidobacteriota bacterium]